MQINKKYIIAGGIGLVAGFAGSSIYGIFFSSAALTNSSACTKAYALTSQLLPCMSFDVQSDRIHALDAQLDAAAALYVSEGKADKVSIYVRDLASSQYSSSNETEEFAPASLLKLPLMIAYYKVAEIEPDILTTKLTYEATSSLNDSTQDFASASKLTAGTRYSVETLIEDMIINSDNNAAAVLLQHIDPRIFENTLVDLGIEIPANGSTLDFVTVKNYSGIFRMLYNASYLNRVYSEKSLEIMSKEAFKGIAVPLPASLVVAHKFGEREVDNTDGSVATRELHDCGIVYNGSRPYSLCIMTQGSNFADLQSIISDISATAYQYLK